MRIPCSCGQNHRPLAISLLSSHNPLMTESIPREILDDLYEYPRKRTALAFVLWGVLGVFGAHRIYLNRTWTGILMLLTGGGALLWWVIDAFLIKGMVRDYNARQTQREQLRIPPVALDFLPVSDGSELSRRPEWDDPASQEGTRGMFRVTADALVLVLAGYALGAVARLTGNIESITAVGALIVVTNFGHQLAPLHSVPLVGDLVRWSYRLRLFYHHVRPGSTLSRLVRPIAGFVFAPFRKRSRAEVGLYLRLGGAFVVLFLLEDLATEVVQPAVARADLSGLTGGWWLKDVVFTLLNIYAFAVPIGATLMLYLLSRRSRVAVGVLSLVTVAAIIGGALGGL
jgi:hypothetical protein